MKVKHAFTCTQCGYHEWKVEDEVLGGNECPKCECPMTAAATITVENEGNSS